MGIGELRKSGELGESGKLGTESGAERRARFFRVGHPHKNFPHIRGIFDIIYE